MKFHEQVAQLMEAAKEHYGAQMPPAAEDPVPVGSRFERAGAKCPDAGEPVILRVVGVLSATHRDCVCEPCGTHSEWSVASLTSLLTRLPDAPPAGGVTVQRCSVCNEEHETTTVQMGPLTIRTCPRVPRNMFVPDFTPTPDPHATCTPAGWCKRGGCPVEAYLDREDNIRDKQDRLDCYRTGTERPVTAPPAPHPHGLGATVGQYRVRMPRGRR